MRSSSKQEVNNIVFQPAGPLIQSHPPPPPQHFHHDPSHVLKPVAVLPVPSTTSTAPCTTLVSPASVTTSVVQPYHPPPHQDYWRPPYVPPGWERQPLFYHPAHYPYPYRGPVPPYYNPSPHHEAPYPYPAPPPPSSLYPTYVQPSGASPLAPPTTYPYPHQPQSAYPYSYQHGFPYPPYGPSTCPCPIQPCPKNAHGPLTGDSKDIGGGHSNSCGGRPDERSVATLTPDEGAVPTVTTSEPSRSAVEETAEERLTANASSQTVPGDSEDKKKELLEQMKERFARRLRKGTANKRGFHLIASQRDGVLVEVKAVAPATGVPLADDKVTSSKASSSPIPQLETTITDLCNSPSPPPYPSLPSPITLPAGKRPKRMPAGGHKRISVESPPVKVRRASLLSTLRKKLSPVLPTPTSTSSTSSGEFRPKNPVGRPKKNKAKVNETASLSCPQCVPPPFHSRHRSGGAKWSNGWRWIGEPRPGPVFLNCDDSPVIRQCYSAMEHLEGDVIRPRDCVLLKSGPKQGDLPYVAKVAALFEDPVDGEMKLSVLWYYRPEQLEAPSQNKASPDEVFASRHRDISVPACVEDKCYVLTFNEYLRYRSQLRREEEDAKSSCASLVPPLPSLDSYPRKDLIPSLRVPPDRMFFCYRVYDFRQKRILKNPS
ncbi:unnamed protein product [Cyprideis torosa]|uniref:Uncharacterized protein n=1 Tax=Cyprideis torosa TaxID=163714 RepID=A0A7R8ZM07_9CRUS|nr:unnamed protein product [Cyprideis torosa]CAG0894472.1 unnamed protein product [Cyprideis torosa]